jgi:prepilin-type N-terminal cleavage/methylation domain-containing protein
VRRPRGLTLLETLVALVVAALVLAAVPAAVVRVAAARARATAVADRVAAGRIVLLRLAAELEAAVARAGIAVDGAPAPAGPGARLRFTSTAPVPVVPGAAASDRRVLAYEVVPAPRRGAPGVLVRREAEPLAAADPVPVPVLAGVRVFAVRAFDGVAWSAAWPASAPPPAAVAVTLAVDDGAGGAETLSTTVALAAVTR